MRPSAPSDSTAHSRPMRPKAVRLTGRLLGSKGSISTTQPKRLGSLTWPPWG
ncbi:hypothetical protein D3C80_1321610 [compost metagenome]